MPIVPFSAPQPAKASGKFLPKADPTFLAMAAALMKKERAPQATDSTAPQATDQSTSDPSSTSGTSSNGA